MHIKSTKNTVIAALVFSVLSGVSTLGHSNSAEVDVASVRVSYADLDLNKKEGQHVLLMRIRNAADQVCGIVMSKAASEVREKRECFETALHSALREVGGPQLTSID